MLDCTIKVPDLINRSQEIGLDAVAITDHESLSAHVTALNLVRDLKKDGKLKEDFKLILGNEIYLIDKMEDVKENYVSGVTKFNHFILLAKDKIGYRQLSDISSNTWDKNYFKTGRTERVPTTKADIENVIGENKGHLIATTACLGGKFPQLVLAWKESEKANDKMLVKEIKMAIHKFVKWNIATFGKENFFIELQPSDNIEQIIFNKGALEIAKAYKLDWIIATDSHYLKKEDRPIHEAFLKSRDDERELFDFYATTYMMEDEDLRSHFSYISEEDLEQGLNGTSIYDMIETFDLAHETIVPEIELPEFEVQHFFKDYYDDYEYIKKFAYSDSEQDKYYLYQVELGFQNKEPYKLLTEDEWTLRLETINFELEQIWEISIIMGSRISSYYVLTQKVLQIMWDKGDSLVGISRGSITGWLTGFYMDIHQMNPLKWNLPNWRHLVTERPEMPDIDIDTQQSKRGQIIDAVKEYFGEDNVLNICTFKTEASKAAIKTAARGLDHVPDDSAQAIADLIPFVRGNHHTLSQCLYGDEGKGIKPSTEFINKINEYEGLKETALGIEGLVSGRSIHACGVYIFKDGYKPQNALMRAPSGQKTTQYTMEDSDYRGGLKLDFLTVQALDKIRIAMDLCIENELMEYQGTLKKTYDKYLHPNILDYDNEEMWGKVGKGEVIDLFQFVTDVGLSAAKAVKPKSLPDLAAANSLMRLMGDGHGDTPIDQFVAHKENIEIWYEEMKEYGLTPEEIEIMKEHLDEVYGVADTQEVVMAMCMDKRIAGGDIVFANKVRKGIAKKKPKLLAELSSKFMKMGADLGTSTELLSYVWNVQFARQFGYSFSKNHTFPYSGIAVQQLNIVQHYSKICWNTACLTVNAGANEGGKATKYGKVAKAIGEIKSRGAHITLPYINQAKYGFSPDLENERIIFGLKGMTNVGNNLANAIIENRPYTSFEDFYQKMIGINFNEDSENENAKRKGVGKVQFATLIKAGCFDELHKDITREELLKKYLRMIDPPKKAMTVANIPRALTLDLFSKLEMTDEIKTLKQFAIFMNRFGKRKKDFTVETVEIQRPRAKKPNKVAIYELDDKIVKFLEKTPLFDIISIENADYSELEEGGIRIYEDILKKASDKILVPFKEYLKTPEVTSLYNELVMEELIEHYGAGGYSKWEMDTVGYYDHEHELKDLNEEKYEVINFFEEPEIPEVLEYTHWGKRKIPKFHIHRIAGTVLDRDKNKKTVSVLTQYGVVNAKFYSGQFVHYDKQISEKYMDGDVQKKRTIEESWFSRGNKVLITGYRRENQFVAKTYKNSVYQHSVTLIEDLRDNGDVLLKLEREFIEED